MSWLSKVIVCAALLVCTAVLGYGFVVEHSAVLHHTPGASAARMMGCLAGFLALVVALAVWGAYEVARFFGERAETWILQGGTQASAPAPELEEAERVLKQGEPLEAIRLLRDYLQRHPDELQVMTRIAEIYRDRLHNFLAAALEYEALLQHKLPDQQWGWAALHLATLYARLNQPEKSLAVLERLQREYGHTLAAKRARARMSSPAY